MHKLVNVDSFDKIFAALVNYAGMLTRPQSARPRPQKSRL